MEDSFIRDLVCIYCNESIIGSRKIQDRTSVANTVQYTVVHHSTIRNDRKKGDIAA